jgi:hypothetical protein
MRAILVPVSSPLGSVHRPTPILLPISGWEFRFRRRCGRIGATVLRRGRTWRDDGFYSRQRIAFDDSVVTESQSGYQTMTAPENRGEGRIRQILDRALYLFAGDERALQEWLHRPDPQLGDMTPQQVIDAGQPEAVAFIIEEALQGDPD